MTGSAGANRLANVLGHRSGLRKRCKGGAFRRGEVEQPERGVSLESPFGTMCRHIRHILRLCPLHARANALYERKCRMCQPKPVFQKPAFMGTGK